VVKNYNAVNSNGETALYLAIHNYDEHNCPLKKEKDKATVQLLLQHPNIDPNIQNNQGETPLFSAVTLENMMLAELLLSNGKTDISVKNNNGETVIDYAKQYCSPQFTQRLKNCIAISKVLSLPVKDIACFLLSIDYQG
jgi:ankyrin repeat protein